MGRVSDFIEGNPSCTLRDIRAGVKGKNDYIDAATRILIAEDYVERIQDGHAGRHSSARRYVPDDQCAPDSKPAQTSNVPHVPPCAVNVPPRAPGHGQPNVPRAPVSKDGARGHVDGIPAADDRDVTSFDANSSALSQRIHEIAALPDEGQQEAAWHALEVEMGLAA
jgi:hypothetical protein